MNSMVEATGSPSGERFFDGWRELTNDTDRPMLFPQVHGHTSGKFWLPTSADDVVALHFDFGLINVERRTKLLVECDSRRYHSDNKRYQSDRDRQNVAEQEGWSVRRFTYEDILKRLDRCFENLEADLHY